jgi:hypothetical protein
MGDRYGAAMKAAKALGLLLDLLLLAASLATGGDVGDGIRAIGIIVASMVGALAVFCAVILALGVLAQRQPPYPM